MTSHDRYDPGGGGHELGPAELRERLHAAVSGVEPPDDALERLRQAVPLRRRRRAAATASSAAFVALAAIVLSAGSQMGLMHVGGGADRAANTDGSQGQNSGGTLSGQGDAAHQGTTGQGNGVAVGPSRSVGLRPGSSPQASSPGGGSPAASSGASAVPPCDASSLGQLTISASVVKNGMTYGYADGAVTRPCTVSGPPALAVTAADGSAASGVRIVPDNTAKVNGLPAVTTWGTQLQLNAGQHFQFQFAWSPTSCDGPVTQNPQDTSGGSQTSPSPEPSGSPTPPTNYTVAYQVAGNSASTTLSAECGATLYVTDIYLSGAYPTPAGGS